MRRRLCPITLWIAALAAAMALSGPSATAQANDDALADAVYPGHVRIDPRAIYNVTVRVNARMTDLLETAPGRRVQVGDALMRFDSIEAETLQKSYINRYQNTATVGMLNYQVKETMERIQLTLLWRGLTDEDIAEIEDTGKPIESIKLVAPMAGVVTEVNVVKNQIVNAGLKSGQFTAFGRQVLRIADLDHLQVQAWLPAGLAGSLPRGRHAWISGVEGVAVAGVVEAVLPLIDASTFKQRVLLRPADERAAQHWYPGMRVLLRFGDVREPVAEQAGGGVR